MPSLHKKLTCQDQAREASVTTLGGKIEVVSALEIRAPYIFINVKANALYAGPSIVCYGVTSSDLRSLNVQNPYYALNNKCEKQHISREEQNTISKKASLPPARQMITNMRQAISLKPWESLLLDYLWTTSQRRHLWRNYDWGNLLYPWELLVLNYYLNELRFPRRPINPRGQIEVTLS